MIPLTIPKVLKDENVPIYGDGQNIRDWLHVYDHCSAIDLVIHRGTVGEVYNIGGHNELTNLEVAQKIIHTLNKSPQLITFVPDRLGHDKRYAIDPSKLERLGWMPKYSFDTGIVQTIEWYLESNWVKQMSY